MTTLGTLKRLLLGETWLLPLGIAADLSAALLVRPIASGAWQHLGGFMLLVGALAVLLASVARHADGIATPMIRNAAPNWPADLTRPVLDRPAG